MSSNQYITEEKRGELEKELHRLKHEVRPEVLDRVMAARALGDLKENSEYHASREEQAKMDSRIEEIEYILKHAQIFNKGEHDRVVVGVTVVIEHTKTGEQKQYELVGEEEADITSGKISNTSPIGEALLGKEVGEKVAIMTPGGTIEYKISKII